MALIFSSAPRGAATADLVTRFGAGPGRRPRPRERLHVAAQDYYARLQSEVFDQSLFRDVLARERRRADRSNRPFALVLVSAAASSPGAGPATVNWAAAIEALLAAKRDIDVLGWFARGSVLALLLPEISETEDGAPQALILRISRGIAARRSPEASEGFAIRLYTHSVSASDPVAAGIDRVLTSVTDEDPAVVRFARLKRVLDILGSSALLLALSPVLLLIALAVKLTSRGPILFRQTRIGTGAAPFAMLKFRTMYTGADHAIHRDFVTQFIKAGVASQGDRAPFKLTNDPRITPLGRILRRTSLDELPQLLNVLRGEMSLVGPRPPLPYEVEQYEAWHRRRVLEAKPGITGLWQVKGRSRTSFDDMVRLDLRYARGCSVWTDIKILLATPAAVISGKGAC
jgi:lipopolysaccharide/colanic/teichoic acid biosynthesis glycosyltransferase